MQTAVPTTVMRGGTSKGLYFLADDLPRDAATRDQVLLAAMGSPDERQIDGMGGSHPLTSKVAVVSASQDDDADIDYLFLQVFVDKEIVSDGQNCGNILAGVGPYAIEQGLVAPDSGQTNVRIRMQNSGGIAIATIETPGGVVTYEGKARIDGVPGTSAPVLIDFADVAGSNCGALLPTGSATDEINGIQVTCIDNGMPVVLLRAADLGKNGAESPQELEADSSLTAVVESIRLVAGRLMNLGDVSEKTVPKMCLIGPASHGGVVSTRTFIPHRVHKAIGVLGAASVAAACKIKGTLAYVETDSSRLDIEHPTGKFTVEIDIEDSSDQPCVTRSALLRTARKLMDGQVYIPSSVWSGKC